MTPIAANAKTVHALTQDRAVCSRADERGTALVMSLLILLILTMLGITAMGTSSLQEKMSTGVRQSMTTFQLAESGLQTSLNDSVGTFDITQPTTKSGTFAGTPYKVTTNLLDIAPPARGSGYSSVDYDAANFDQKSVSKGYGGSNTIIHRGVYQIMSKQK